MFRLDQLSQNDIMTIILLAVIVYFTMKAQTNESFNINEINHRRLNLRAPILNHYPNPNTDMSRYHLTSDANTESQFYLKPSCCGSWDVNKAGNNVDCESCVVDVTSGGYRPIGECAATAMTYNDRSGRYGCCGRWNHA